MYFPCVNEFKSNQLTICIFLKMTAFAKGQNMMQQLLSHPPGQTFMQKSNVTCPKNDIQPTGDRGVHQATPSSIF